MRAAVYAADEQQGRYMAQVMDAIGFAVTRDLSITETSRSIARTKPNIVIMCDVSAATVNDLRQWSRVPVIVLSDRGNEPEVLDAGADDFMSWPFDVDIFRARVRLALRHSAQMDGSEPDGRFVVGPIEMNMIDHTVTVKGQPVELTPKEFKLLHYMLQNAGRSLTTRKILVAVWGPAHSENDQYLKVGMSKLRTKLGIRQDAPGWIRTQPGIGYILDKAA